MAICLHCKEGGVEPFDFKDKYAVKKHKRKECTFRKSLTRVKKKKKKKKKVGTAYSLALPLL